MSKKSSAYIAQRAVWRETGDPFFPCETNVDGVRWVVRLNEWPDEPFAYTLMIGDAPVLDFNDWPAAWVRPLRGG